MDAGFAGSTCADFLKEYLFSIHFRIEDPIPKTNRVWDAGDPSNGARAESLRRSDI